MDTNSSTLNYAIQSLLRQAFFASPQTRTIPKIAAWVEKSLATPSVSKLKAELESAIACHPSHEEGVEAVAIQLLRESGLLHVGEVTDLESCFEHFTSWLASPTPPLLTDDVIVTALSAVPGGRELLESYSPHEVRVSLRHFGFGDEHLGHEMLQPYIARNECALGALESANRILADPRRVVGAVSNAIALATTLADRSEIERLLNLVGCVTPLTALIAPNLPHFRSAFVSYVRDEPSGLSKMVTKDLLTVFDPPAHLVRADRGFGDHKDLMQLVYDEIIDSSLLAYESFEPDKNLRRVAHALGFLELDHRQLHGYPRLYRLCRLERSYVRAQTETPTPVALFASLADGYAAVEALAQENGLRRNNKRVSRLILPTRHEFSALETSYGTDPVAALELQTGHSYEMTLAYLAEHRGYALPGRSEPHRVMNRLVLGALREHLVEDPVEEYFEPALFGRLRIDLHALVEYTRPGELLSQGREICFEADGAQHFTTVECWGPSPRPRDQLKASYALKAARKRPLSLLALHHEVLTGSRRNRLSEADLAALTDHVVANQYPWVFVRPQGSRDMRATPRGMNPEPLMGIIKNPRLEVFILPPVM